MLSSYLANHRYKIISSYIQGDILDLGCGHAIITQWLEPDQQYIGIEGRSRVYEWLKKYREAYGFYKFDLDTDVISINQRFDTILLLAVIEHLENPAMILNQIPDLIKQGGKLLITTPTRFGNTIHLTGSKINIFSRAAADDHEIIYSYNSLNNLIVRSGLQIDYYQKFLFGGNQFFVCSLLEPTK
jgi:2-polyprenyl-3-methyl-5-hydroxy-6-metoxy-1,4-benzoquinol methylase